MQKTQRFNPVWILVLFLVIVLIFGCLAILSKRQKVVSKTQPPTAVQESVPGIYKSNFLNLNFEYPPEWGTATNEPEQHKYDDGKSEYVNFANKKDIFLVAGLYDRGGITNGEVIKDIETIAIFTRNGKSAKIRIYQSDSGFYLMEGSVLEKIKSGKFDYHETFYIKLWSMTKPQMMQNKKILQDLFASLSISIN